MYLSKLLEEIGLTVQHSTTYEQVCNKPRGEIIKDNVEHAENLNIKVNETDLDLPVMHWIPKMHKSPIGARFIVASKTCSTKSTASAVSKAFKLITSQIENFHNKSKFYQNYNKFWIVQNVTPIIGKLLEINNKKNAKIISAFDFSTLYTKIPHHLIINILNDIIDFAFSGGKNKQIIISGNKAYWGSRRRQKHYFTKSSLKVSVRHLILNCYFVVGNITMKQVVGIPMGIDPAPFWANLFLYKYESEHIGKLIKSNKIKAKKYHGCCRFIDDLCILNDGGEFNESFAEIYPEEMSLKVEHFGDHGTFLDLDIEIHDHLFVFKLFDKRDEFPFSIVRMPNLLSNIPSKIFYNTIKSEILRIARCTLKLTDFIPRARNLYNRMKNQGGDTYQIKTSLLRFMNKHINTFEKYKNPLKDIIESFSN